MRVLEHAHGLEETELERLVGELAQQLLAHLVADGRRGLGFGEQVDDGLDVRPHLVLVRLERDEHVRDAQDARGLGVVVDVGRVVGDVGHRRACRYSTDREPMRGGQVLTTPRVCDCSTSCVKLFMLA